MMANVVMPRDATASVPDALKIIVNVMKPRSVAPKTAVV